MRHLVLFVALFALTLVSGCQCSGLPSARVKEINAEWYRVYTADRRPTEAEAAEFSALDDAGKAAWKLAGKPYEGALNERLVGAAKDYMESIELEAEAAK